MGMEQRQSKRIPVEQAGPWCQGAIVLVLGTLGSGMILHGFGWHGLDILRPNPKAPPLVFGMIGVFMVLAALIVALKALRTPRWLVNAAGWGALTIGFVLMNWLVFWSGGHAACMIGPLPGIVLGIYGSGACDWMAKTIVLLCDLGVALAALTAISKRIRPNGWF